MIAFDFVYISVAAVLLGIILLRTLKNFGILLMLVILSVGAYFFIDNVTGYLLFVCLPCLFILLIFSFLLTSEKKDKTSLFRVTLTTDKKKKVILENINTGVFISAASGGGKTQSVIYHILKDIIRKEFCGLIYDLKDGELTEIAYPLIKQTNLPLNVFSPNNTGISVRINPIAPEIIKTEAELRTIVSTLVVNLNKSDSTSDAGRFFEGGAKSLISAVIWRLKTGYPDNCHLPFVVGLLLSTDNLHETGRDERGNEIVYPYKRLTDWIKQDDTAELLGATFISGLSNPKQTASLFSTLSEGLSKLVSKNIFYLLSGSDIDLELNRPDNKYILSFIGSTGVTGEFLSPILATLIETAILCMSGKKKEPCFILLDEAPTIKLMNLAEKIATMRSYGFCFIYCIQNQIQLTAQWDGKAYKGKEIIANLSNIFLGKVNDADTAGYQEKFFELIKEEQTSISKGGGGFFDSSDKGGTRVTTSKKERSKYRANEFFKLKAGEFIMVANGVDKKFRFLEEDIIKELPDPQNNISEIEIDTIYKKILRESKNFLNTQL